MLKGWKRRDSLRDEALFEVWFMRILINQCRDCQRRQIRRRKIDEAGKRQAALSAPPAACDGLFEAIHALPVAQRLAVLLYYFDGYSQKEIAGILDCTPERVKSMMRQARGRLRAELTRGEEAGQKKGGNGFG